jgi:hypothetical protein
MVVAITLTLSLLQIEQAAVGLVIVQDQVPENSNVAVAFSPESPATRRVNPRALGTRPPGIAPLDVEIEGAALLTFSR